MWRGDYQPPSWISGSVSYAMQERQTSGNGTWIILLVTSAVSFCSYKAATALAISEAFKGSWCSPQSSSGDKNPLVGVAAPGISADELYFSEAGVCQTRAIRWISHADGISDDHVIISAVCQSEASNGWLKLRWQSHLDFAAGAVRDFVERADDELWLQLLTVMRNAEDPGLAAIQSILRWVAAGEQRAT